MKPSPQVVAVSEALRTALKQLLREMRRDAAGDPSGLPLAQAFLRSTVGDQPGIGVAELARQQNVRGPTISGQVKALEEAGLLERVAREGDRRRSGLQLTPAGRAVLKKIGAQRLDWFAQRVARLTPGQLDAVAAAIEPLTVIAQP
jgi:DNA-binding MarR family transcriptional regulator